MDCFCHSYNLRRKPILRIIKTMLEDKDVCVRRLREGYEFFKSMAQRREDLEAAKAVAWQIAKAAPRPCAHEGVSVRKLARTIPMARPVNRVTARMLPCSRFFDENFMLL